MSLWITHEVVSQLANLGQQFSPLETGGVLLGWHDGSDRIATGLIGPGPRAMHGRYAFVPDHAWQVAQLRKAFAATSGDLNYLGDWHTHPAGPARMSDEDRRTLRRICQKVSCSVMVIIDPSTSEPQIGAWSATRQSLFRTDIEMLAVRPFKAPSRWPSTFVD